MENWSVESMPLKIKGFEHENAPPVNLHQLLKRERPGVVFGH
jgi:hypothetical protein